MEKITVLIFILFSSFCLLAKSPAHTESINHSKSEGIDTTEIVDIGGIKQYISLKGKDVASPILLFLHGGPGGSVMNVANKFTNKLQENFVVVQWDQRETGKTLQLNPSPVPITVALMENDTHDLIGFLLQQFHREKLYLVAHSWGTVLGFYIAGHYPQLLYAYVAISPMVNQSESELMTLSMLKENARQKNNENEIQELSLVRVPFENADQLFYARKWLFAFNGQPVGKGRALKRYVQSWSSTWLAVWNEALKQNLIKDLPVINCPVYFCVGRKDYQTNFSITEQYYNMLSAPKKQLFWFEKSGHLIPNSEPGLLQDIIIDKILPATF